MLKVPNRIVWKVPPKWLAWWPLVWRKDLEQCQAACQDALVELTEARMQLNQQAQREHNISLAKAGVEAERDQIKDSYQRLVGSQKVKNTMRKAQLEAYRMWFKSQRKDFLALSKRFLEIANDNGMQEKHVEDLLKGVEDAGTEQEAGRENPDRGIDHDHPGTSEGGQGAFGDRGAEVGAGDQAGSQSA